MASQVRMLDVNGRTISCSDSGGDGPLMVLVHGFGADRSSYSLTIPQWSPSHRVVALDLPGHGGSPAVGDAPDLKQLAELVLGVIDQLGGICVHLVGHSLGGAACLVAADLKPERIARLSLIAPFGIGAAFHRDFATRFIAMEREEEALAVLRLLVARPSMVSPRMAQAVLSHLATLGVRGLLQQLAAHTLYLANEKPDPLGAVYDALALPVQLIWGEADTILSPDFGHSRFQSALRIAGAGHMPQLEQATTVGRAILAFAQG